MDGTGKVPGLGKMQKYINTMKPALLGLILASASTCAGAADSFSCLYGSQPACLDAGDTVCMSEGKCVAEDAVCLSAGQCDYQGFTCRSDFLGCAEDYDDLKGEYNDLVDEYNELLAEHRTLMDEQLELLEEAEQAYEDILALYDCVGSATTLEEAKTCE